MTMTPRLHRFTLTAHILCSVGWLGSIVAYLALAIAGLTSLDAQMVRAAYLSMAVIGWFVIVPFSLSALLTGLVQSLGTQWGLFRHYWILAKFLLTTGAAIVLLLHMQAVSRMAGVAADTTLSGGDSRALRIQLVVHACGALLVLLAATTLSLYKPRGMTPYGRRRASESDLTFNPDLSGEASAGPDPGSTTRAPRWVYVVGIHAIGLALLFVVLHLAGGGVRGH